MSLSVREFASGVKFHFEVRRIGVDRHLSTGFFFLVNRTSKGEDSVLMLPHTIYRARKA